MLACIVSLNTTEADVDALPEIVARVATGAHREPAWGGEGGEGREGGGEEGEGRGALGVDSSNQAADARADARRFHPGGGPLRTSREGKSPFDGKQMTVGDSTPP